MLQRMKDLSNVSWSIGSLWRELRHRPKWIVYILLALGIGTWEMRVEYWGQEPGLSPGRPISLPDRLYQWYATAGNRKPKPHFVQIVVLSPSQEPAEIFDDTCKKREFVAALLDRIAPTSPSTAVLDFWYPTEFCNSGDGAQRSSKLQAAIQQASDRFPVVIGSSTHTERELELENDPDLPRLTKSGLTDRDQILDARYTFTGKNVSYGLVRINGDTQQISTVWPTYPSKSAVISHAHPEIMPSLAYAAAIVYSPLPGRRLIHPYQADEHTFTAFAPESEFDPIHAIDLLCGNYRQGDDWRHCEPPKSVNGSRFNSLKGKIVLITQQNVQSDLWGSVDGEVPGYLLRANYIESLLSDRYTKPVGPAWETLSILLGTIVTLIVLEERQKRFIRLAKAVLTLAIVVFGSSLLLMYLGRFTIIALPLGIVAFIHFSIRLLRFVISGLGPSRQPLPKVSRALTVTENVEI